jgi:tRNA (mo5U34)-methyltransferase
MNDKQMLVERVNNVTWFHTIDLGDGVITRGYENSPKRLKLLKLPETLAGKTVLDVGSWDGFFAFEAERRGAKRVLATDNFCWGGEGWGTKDGFNLARTALESKVEDKEIDVLSLSPEEVGVFDVVLFLGVLYHMRHPLLALEKVASVTGEMLILDTHVDLVYSQRPLMAFYPEKELNNDPTNWFGPNPKAVIEMLKLVGFKRVEVVSKVFNPAFRTARAFKRLFINKEPFLKTLQEDRMVFHAWK